jgi:hypothetical protein
MLAFPLVPLHATCNSILTWFGNRCGAGEQPIFAYFGSSGLILSLVPLCMGPYRTQLFICHNQDQRPRPYPHDRLRPGPASNHARWPDSPTP